MVTGWESWLASAALVGNRVSRNLCADPAAAPFAVVAVLFLVREAWGDAESM